MPSIDLVTNPLNDVDVNGANIALWIQLRTYANHPAFEGLELFLSPRDIKNEESVQRFGAAVLEPPNRGQGRLEMHSIYAIGDIWSDARPRILHTDDLWALSRDRYLRDTLARGPMAHVCDTHCLGHFALHRALREVAGLEQRAGDTIVACSTATAAAVRDSYDLPYEVTSLPRRIDAHGLEPATAEQKRDAREQLGLPQDLMLGLFIGRVTPAMKAEVTLLIDALVGHEGGLVVAGVCNMPGYPEILISHAKSLGVADRLFVRGRFAKEERKALYAASDLFLFPGDCLNEAFGQTTIEALACGLPVIQSAWDGLKDTLTPDAGSLIPTRAAPVPERLEQLSVAIETPRIFLALAQATVIDRDAWFAAYAHWSSDAAARAVAGEAGRRLFEDRFLPSKLDEGYAALLAGCLHAACSGARTAKESSSTQLNVDYTRLMSHYTSEPWSADLRFEETEMGSHWRSGGRAPLVYVELEPLLDFDLLATIQERVSQSAIKAGELGRMLSCQGTTSRDVVYHAMFLAKQGFLRVCTFE